METLVGTTGALAIALFLAGAPNANAAADGIPLQPVSPSSATADQITNDGVGIGLGSVGIGDGRDTLGLGSVQLITGGAGSVQIKPVL
ncbi:hypothetical protein [Nocardia sp. NPDC020380]|uniref:hypothetical protein n=1 Tax=Nocardia sp. NPDC020380 TaxID=3364309 RepID=UPI0037A71968